jgi:hypothetical protein
MHDINLSLAIEEVNLILEGLGNLQFAKVYALVGKIQEQAAQQIKSANASRPEAVPAPAQPVAARK